MKSILSHLKTIITAGWQNAAIYTKRTWPLSTFTASLTLSLLMCQVVEPWNYPPPSLIHLSNHPSIPLRHFHHEQPTRSRWESESLVWFVLSGLRQTAGGRLSLTALFCDRHTSQHPPGGSPDMKQARQGVPSWCHHHQTSPASSNLPSGWMWTDAWQPPRAFTSHSCVSKGMQERRKFWHRSFCKNSKILDFLFLIFFFFFFADEHPLSSVQQLVCHFSLNRFPRCSTIGVSLAKVVYSACLPLHLLPPKTSWRPERAQSIILGLAQLWTCSQEWSSFTSPSLPSSPYTPTLPKPTKKSAPLNSTATPRSLTGEANLRGALCFRLRNTLAIHMRLTVWRCGSQKNNNKNKHYEIWSVAWNPILVKCLLSDGMEYGSVANDSSNILKGRPSILK